MKLNVVSSRAPFTYFVVVLCLLPSFMTQAQSVDSDEVLASLAASDDSIMNDFTLVAEVVWPLTVPQPDSERAHERVKATRADSVWAYRADADEDTPPPNYEGIDPRSIPSGISRGGSSNQGEDLGSVMVHRKVWYSVLSEPEFGGYRELGTSFQVKPDGSVTTTESESDYVHITKPVEPLQLREFYIMVLTSGRGYSMYLDKIDSAESLPDGLIRCRASGRYPGANRNACTWELVIDPDAAYLVREAKAFFPQGGRLKATFENEGIQWLEKGPLPETGRFRQGADKIWKRYFRGDGYTEIAYLSLESGADHQLISDTRALLRGDYPLGTKVIDSRVQPALSYRVGEISARKLRSLTRTRNRNRD